MTLIQIIQSVVFTLLTALFGDPLANESTIKLYLSTSADEFLVNINSSEHPQLNYSIETAFVIHGFTGDPRNKDFQNLTLALVKTGVNVITVDWMEMSRAPNYVAAVENEEVVAKFLSDYILRNNFDLNIIRCIGHSLGAHICGLLGKDIKERTGGKKVGRIIGLDPAGPLFGGLKEVEPKRRLDRDDAKQVITLSTNQYLAGSKFLLGKVNFVANNGIIQPGCDKEKLEIGCSHGLAVPYYTEALSSNGFVGRMKGSNETLVFGDGISKNAEGNYDLITNDKPPYALF